MSEYWIVDPDAATITVHLLQASGMYLAVPPVDGIVISRVMPQLKIILSALFQDLR